MKNNRFIIGSFIVSALIVSACNKTITKDNFDNTIINQEENIQITLGEDLLVSEAPSGLNATVKILDSAATTDNANNISEVKELSFVGLKEETDIELSFKLKDALAANVSRNAIGDIKTFVISEYKEGKWSDIGNYYPSTVKEFKTRIKLKKGLEQKVILAVREKTDAILITNEDRYSTYNSAGILMSEAIKQELNLDFMLYPSASINTAAVTKTFKWKDTEDLSLLYATYITTNKVAVGTIKGKDLKEFIAARIKMYGNLDFQGGVFEYDLKYDYLNRVKMSESSFILNGKKIKDEKIYTIGLNDYDYNKGTFNTLANFKENFTLKEISADTHKVLLDKYLKETTKLPNFKRYTSKVLKEKGDTFEGKKIYDIQGTGFKSPLEGHFVKRVEGIITAVDAKGTNAGDGINGFYFQDINGDGDDKTSDAIYVRYSLKKTDTAKLADIRVGNKIYLDAMVEEYVSPTEGLSQTQLINVEILQVSETNQALPDPVVLGVDRKIPTGAISTYRGDLNNKAILNLADGIDFYESIEGMRVAINNPLVTDVYNVKQIYVVAPDNYDKELFNDMGGIVIKENDMNPEVMVISGETIIGSGTDLTTFSHPAGVTKGAKFTGKVEGVIKYNTGNNGGYTFVNTKRLPNFQTSASVKESVNLVGDRDNLTIGSYNVENLFATATHMDKIAASIVNNLKNPDILGLIEIQDNDGEKGSSTSSAADQTLQILVDKIKIAGGPEYKYINIDPEFNKDGGAPGGNIRVAYIYNPARVTFSAKGNADYKTVGSISADGTLNMNPVKIDPVNSAFENSRKSLAAQFEFNGKRVTIIANHLNSKSGDPSQWGAIQPVILNSVIQRTNMATTINSFAKELVNKGENVVLLGDFNEFYFEKAMQVFKGTLDNLMETLPLNERYTYVYKGNSQTLDHMLVSPNLYKNASIDIVHINAGFIDQISDHDPVVSKFFLPKSI